MKCVKISQQHIILVLLMMVSRDRRRRLAGMCVFFFILIFFFFFFFYSATQICAGNPPQDTCLGDSGGPLFDQNTFIIYGITSYGVFCGSSEGGVYTRVSAFNDWITKEFRLVNGFGSLEFAEQQLVSPKPSIGDNVTVGDIHPRS